MLALLSLSICVVFMFVAVVVVVLGRLTTSSFTFLLFKFSFARGIFSFSCSFFFCYRSTEKAKGEEERPEDPTKGTRRGPTRRSCAGRLANLGDKDARGKFSDAVAQL